MAEIDEQIARVNARTDDVNDSMQRTLDHTTKVVAECTRLVEEKLLLEQQLQEAREDVTRLRSLINTPQVENFLEAVRIEAAHQQERWPAEQDAGKADSDWFWLIGYLAGKAIRPDCTQEKRLHHIITTAAVCLNWHRHATGEVTAMRPGIAPPKEATHGA